MMIDPALIVFAVQALVRLVHEGSKAYEQYERDRNIFLPTLQGPNVTPIVVIRSVFVGTPHSPLVEAGGSLARFWLSDQRRPNPTVAGAEDALYIEARRLIAEDAAKNGQVLPLRGTEVAGALMIRQWREGTEPVGPIGRMALTLADIGLEFVGSNASVLGIGGNAEKLIGALAANLAEMIPNDGDQFGPQSQLGQRLLGIFARAALQTFNDNSRTFVSKEALQQLIAQTLPPIIQALPATLPEQSEWRRVTDALLGPAADAAMRTISENPVAFCGKDFAPQKAIGAVTQALLHEASTKSLLDDFSEAGLIALYRKAIGVAADRPELFIGGDGKAVEVARTLIGGVAGKLAAAPIPLNGDLGIAVAGVILDTVKQFGPAFLDQTKPWEGLAGDLLVQIAEGLRPALENKDASNVLAPEQLVRLVRTVLERVAHSPGMIAGGNTDLPALLQTVTTAITQDPNLLLSPDDWLHLAGSLAQSVATDPERLLRLIPGAAGSPQVTLAAALIGDLLSVAAAERAAGSRAGVLFGATLSEAIAIALEAALGNVEEAMKNRGAVRDLADSIAKLVRSKPGSYGSKEWLWLFRSLIGRVLRSGEVNLLSEQLAAQILEGGIRK
jgi:hypothetical protein